MKSNEKAAVILAAVIVVSVVGINYMFSTLNNDTTISTATDQVGETTLDIDKSNFKQAPTLVIDKSNFKQAPTLTGIVGYINIEPEELQKEIDGKVVLYDIWTYSCINCIRTLPYVTDWNEKYADDGLLIIGIHSPEFEFEKDFESVKTAVSKHGITYPVVLDNDFETWKSFGNHYWPHKFIADHEGFLRYDHIGEGAYDKTERVIQELLKERANSLGIDIVFKELSE